MRDFIIPLKSLEIYFSKKSVYGNESNTPYKSVVIAYRTGKRRFYFPMDICEKLDGDKYPRCALYCDRGNFKYDKNFSFYIEYGLTLTDTEEPYEIELSQKHKKEFVAGKRMKCPEKILKLFTYYRPDTDNSKNADSIKGRYVCYSYKDRNYKTGRWEYNDCRTYKRHCKDYRLSYFGHYPNITATKAALKRCRKGHPNLDYVDNPKGRFVCYDYNDKYGSFIGCFRSIKSCDKLNKKQYGIYKSKSDTEDGYHRCHVGLIDKD